jgi:uncharacterized membrane protein
MVSLGFIIIGMFMSMIIMENRRGRYIGWLLLAIGMFINAYSLAFLSGKWVVSLLNVGAGILDLYLFFFWRRRYKESKLSNRERFLEEIMKLKK